MVGTTGGGAQRQQVLGVRRSPEGGQGGAQREQVLGVRRSPGGGATLTVDLHVEGQAGAARRVVGSAAVVTAVGRAQGL